MPGENLEDALRICDRVASSGLDITLGYFPRSSDIPMKLVDVSCSIVDVLAGRYPRAYPSIKPPAFNYDADLLAMVAERAARLGLLTHLDSHEHFTASRTLGLLEKLATLGGQIGITVPGRWHRSVDDSDLIKSLGARPRIVKGEWADPQDPGRNPRQGFMDVVERFAGYEKEVAVATHDPELLRTSLKVLTGARTPCQVELLNGLPMRKSLAVAREFGVGVRMYVPFGEAWRPYAMSKFRQNPRILLWLISDAAQGMFGSWKR